MCSWPKEPRTWLEADGLCADWSIAYSVGCPRCAVSYHGPSVLPRPTSQSSVTLKLHLNHIGWSLHSTDVGGSPGHPVHMTTVGDPTFSATIPGIRANPRQPYLPPAASLALCRSQEDTMSAVAVLEMVDGPMCMRSANGLNGTLTVTVHPTTAGSDADATTGVLAIPTATLPEKGPAPASAA